MKNFSPLRNDVYQFLSKTASEKMRTCSAKLRMKNKNDFEAPMKYTQDETFVKFAEVNLVMKCKNYAFKLSLERCLCSRLRADVLAKFYKTIWHVKLLAGR